MLIVLLVLFTGSFFVINFYLGGQTLVLQGLNHTTLFAYKYILVLILGLSAIGQAYSTFTHPAVFAYIKDNFGVFQSLVASIFAPGAYTMFPLAKDLYEGGEKKSIIIFFIVSSGVCNWQVFLFKWPLLGFDLAIKSYIVGLVFVCVSAVFLFMVEKLRLI